MLCMIGVKLLICVQVEIPPKRPERTEPPTGPHLSITPQPSPTALAVSRHQRSLSISSTCSTESVSDSLSDQPTMYSDYLQEARTRMISSTAACSCWTWRYDGLHPTPTQAVEMLDAARTNPPMLYSKPRAQSDPLPIQDTSQDARIRSCSLPSGDRTDKSGSPVVNGVCDSENVTKSAQHGSMGGKGGERVTGQGVGGDEENLDSLGESSGYESFNIRASRDSSPVNSSDGTPRSQIAQGPANVVEESSQNLPDDELRERQGSLGTDDQEFMDTIQRSSTPTELTGLEETLCEIDQAFTAFKIYDLSSSKSYNKVRHFWFIYLKLIIEVRKNLLK